MSIPVKTIHVNQAEGRIGHMVERTCETWADACNALITIAFRHEGRGYLKTDVGITWADGTTLGLRADVMPLGSDRNDINLRQMAERWARFTLEGPSWAEPAARARMLAEMAELDGHAERQAKARRILSGELSTRDPDDEERERIRVLARQLAETCGDCAPESVGRDCCYADAAAIVREGVSG